MTQRNLHVAQILWPAFLIAGILEMVVFSLVDPATLRFGSWQPEAQTTYSLAFLIFWALVSASSLISYWMMRVSGASAAQRRQRRQSRRPEQVHHA